MKYKVGDKVRIVSNKGGMNHHCNKGDICKVLKEADCDGDLFLETSYGMTRFVNEHDVELLTKSCKEITITSDGKTTTAVFTVDGREVKRGIAKCSPEDKFNFKYGAELALERMWNGEKPKEKHWYFSKEKYLSYPENAEKDKAFRMLTEFFCEEAKTWVDDIDGCPVENDRFDGRGAGRIDMYKVEKEWCEYR